MKFTNGMEITTTSGHTRVLNRWTKAGKDRIYINGGSRNGDGFVDLINKTYHLNGGLKYQVEIAEMVLEMFAEDETEKCTDKEENQAKEIKTNAIRRIELKLEDAQKMSCINNIKRTIPMWEMALETINKLFDVRFTDAKSIIEAKDFINKVVTNMENQWTIASRDYDTALKNMKTMCGK